MSEVCLELAKEGPLTEEEVFTKDPQNPAVLLFTDWSRWRAQLWRAFSGRRFACYNVGKDKGMRGAGWRLRGSLKVVGTMQARAAKASVRVARA
eukprot:6472974-Lingulodinium_polyedra.AAC.1